MLGKKTIAIDFDGTMNFYDHWCNGPIINQPIEGCIEALKAFRDMGYEVEIYTCRTNPEINNVSEQLGYLRQWLNDNGLPFVMIWTNGKPIADVYIDDRAITFKNNWNEILTVIKNKNSMEGEKQNVGTNTT